MWVNRVPEPKTVKQRVHLDLVAATTDPLVAAGAYVVRRVGQGAHRWTLMADPEGGEFCVFEGADEPSALVVDSADPVADAAGVALAVFPSTGGLEGPPAVALADDVDWASGIAAASLMAEPVGAPTLLTSDGDVPEPTTSALKALAPQGSAATDDRQIFRIGDAAELAVDTGALHFFDPETGSGIYDEETTKGAS